MIAAQLYTLRDYLVPPEKVVDLEVSWIGHGSGDPIGIHSLGGINSTEPIA